VKSKILILDDDAELLANYEDLLEYEGYNVFSYTDPRKVMFEFKAGFYDLAILDVSIFGDKNAGFFVCREIRKIDEKIIIAMNTAWGISGNEDASISSGANAIWSKSIELNEFIEKIYDVLNLDGD